MDSKTIEQLKRDAAANERLRSWYTKIPHVPFQPEWDVRAVPAFGGAIVRYRIQHMGADISVYLDAYDALGCVGKPYWQIYPDANGDAERFLMADVGDLVSGIADAIEVHKKEAQND